MCIMYVISSCVLVCSFALCKVTFLTCFHVFFCLDSNCSVSYRRAYKDTKTDTCEGDKLNTWRGSDAEVACKVVFECIENSSHVRLHFIQTDDVFHQRWINIHLSRLALCLGLEDEKRGKKKSSEGRVETLKQILIWSSNPHWCEQNCRRWTHVNPSLLTDLLLSWWHRAWCMQRGGSRCLGTEAVDGLWRWPQGDAWPVAPETDTTAVAAGSDDSKP